MSSTIRRIGSVAFGSSPWLAAVLCLIAGCLVACGSDSSDGGGAAGGIGAGGSGASGAAGGGGTHAGGTGGGGQPPGFSDPFPAYEPAPELESYVSDGDFEHTYHIAPDGDDGSGNGSTDNPWATINGARTGGSGTPVDAGDLVYFHGGTYQAVAENPDWKEGPYYLDADGTPTDHIVLAAYPGETPVFEAPDDDHISLQIRGNYVVVDGLTFTSGSLTFWHAEHGVVQNCVFEQHPFDPWGDQMNATHLGVNDGAHDMTIRNNTFSSANGHAIKTYASDFMPERLSILYNRFHTGDVSYGQVVFKSAIADHEVAYNRFEGLSADAISIGSSYEGQHDGLSIHHNAFDACTGSILVRVGSDSVGEVFGVSFHDNLVLGASSGGRVLLELDSNDGGISEGTGPLGEFYDNALYDLQDCIDPEESAELGNYPGYWNYNAYPSAAVQSSAENVLGLPDDVWQGSALVLEDHGVLRTGTAGDRFYSVAPDSALRGAGRDGGNIGGFVWSQ